MTDDETDDSPMSVPDAYSDKTHSSPVTGDVEMAQTNAGLSMLSIVALSSSRKFGSSSRSPTSVTSTDTDMTDATAEEATNAMDDTLDTVAGMVVCVCF